MSADGLNGRCYISGEECNYDGYCNRFEIYDDLLNIIEEEVEIKELTLKYIVKDDKIKIVGVKE
jgi:chromosome condensin MukBEF MukE localization factor